MSDTILGLVVLALLASVVIALWVIADKLWKIDWNKCSRIFTLTFFRDIFLVPVLGPV